MGPCSKFDVGRSRRGPTPNPSPEGEGLAVEQQMPRHRRGQRLPSRARLHQRQHLGRGGERRIPHRIGNHPHGPLRNRIAQIQRAHLPLIIERDIANGTAREARTSKLERRTRLLAPGRLATEHFHCAILYVGSRAPQRARANQITWRGPLPFDRAFTATSSTAKPASFNRRTNFASGPADHTASTPPGARAAFAADSPRGA